MGENFPNKPPGVFTPLPKVLTTSCRQSRPRGGWRLRPGHCRSAPGCCLSRLEIFLQDLRWAHHLSLLFPLLGPSCSAQGFLLRKNGLRGCGPESLGAAAGGEMCPPWSMESSAGGTWGKGPVESSVWREGAFPGFLSRPWAGCRATLAFSFFRTRAPTVRR